MRSQTLKQMLVVVVRAVAGPMQLERRLEVLGDRPGRESADRLQCGGPDQGTRPTPEHGVQVLASRQQDFEEEALLVVLEAGVLRAVAVAEEMRRLHEGD